MVVWLARLDPWLRSRIIRIILGPRIISCFLSVLLPGWIGWRVGQLVLVSLSDVAAKLCLHSLDDQIFASESVGTGKMKSSKNEA